MNKPGIKFLIIVLAAFLMTGCQSTGNITTASLIILKNEGRIRLYDKNFEALSIPQNYKMNPGEKLETSYASLAKVAFSSNIAVTLDEVSTATFKQNDNDLRIILDKGRIFFEAAESIESDATLTLATTTTLMNIRGASGCFYKGPDGNDEIIVTEGTVELTATNESSKESRVIKVPEGHRVKIRLTNKRKNSIDFEESEINEKQLDTFMVDRLKETGTLLQYASSNTGWSANEMLSSSGSGTDSGTKDFNLITSVNDSESASSQESATDEAIAESESVSEEKAEKTAENDKSSEEKQTAVATNKKTTATTNKNTTRTKKTKTNKTTVTPEAGSNESATVTIPEATITATAASPVDEKAEKAKKAAEYEKFVQDMKRAEQAAREAEQQAQREREQREREQRESENNSQPSETNNMSNQPESANSGDSSQPATPSGDSSEGSSESGTSGSDTPSDAPTDNPSTDDSGSGSGSGSDSGSSSDSGNSETPSGSESSGDIGDNSASDNSNP